MSKLQSARGTQDFTDRMCQAYRFIDSKALECAKRYGFSEVSTPIFEFSEVFHRGLGDSTDMIMKETYSFTDRGGDLLTLRPEGTAGIARAFVSNGWAQLLPLKLYYAGPMFRYERPQKGRYRQFHQFGIESLGSAHWTADLDVLALAWDFLLSLGLKDQFRLELNSLGDLESRKAHRQKLVDYLQAYKNDLSEDSKIRLERNPLRILDSKDLGDKKIVSGAPRLQDSMNSDSKKFFDQVKNGLTLLNIPFYENPNLVRGIDYYTHSVFEFVTENLGAQGAILSGGRYDGLIELLGGPATPGVGWACGFERLAMMVQESLFLRTPKPVAIISADESSQEYCLRLAHQLRNFVAVEILIEGQVGKKFKRADKMGCGFAVVIGEAERKSGKLSLKNLATGDQKSVTESELLSMQFD